MGKHRKNIIYTRIFKSAFIIFIIFVILLFRLSWIQIIKSEEYKLAALKQRGKKIEVYPPRGIIYDKNLIPLTNKDKIPTLFFNKDYIQKDKEAFDFIMELSKSKEKEIDKKDIRKFEEIQLDKSLDNEKLPKGIFFGEKVLRYDENNILSHVIGHVKKSENEGKSGIEKTFDEVLKKENTGSVYLEMDSKRNLIPGGGYTLISNERFKHPNSVQLTIDYHIQKIVENVMDEEIKKGAVIVCDVESGDIVAMASRPNFNQKEVNNFLSRENMEFYNKAIQVSYPPGSLFKIVVLLAALEDEQSVVDENFYCKGFEELNNLVIKCNKEEGHGKLSIKDAFAKSCNSVFIQLGKRVGSDKIIDMAKRLGYGQKMNIGLIEEITGNLPKDEEIKGPSIGNISIGQGSIEVTPLQVTNMMMILANEGIQKDLSIVNGIVTEDGKMIKKFNREEDMRVVSKKHSKIVNEYMKEVITNGTGKKINIEDIGGCCGKTGSAQAALNGKNTVHGWFAGYFPRKRPEYVITVFVEDNYSGSAAAMPTFEKISKEIWKKNR